MYESVMPLKSPSSSVLVSPKPDTTMILSILPCMQRLLLEKTSLFRKRNKQKRRKGEKVDETEQGREGEREEEREEGGIGKGVRKWLCAIIYCYFSQSPFTRQTYLLHVHCLIVATCCHLNTNEKPVFSVSTPMKKLLKYKTRHRYSIHPVEEICKLMR